MLLGVDVGGTFTDAVLAVEGRIVTAKSPTTPKDQSEGVMAAVTAALEKAGRSANEVEVFAHGMTVVTNALLEGAGARTALIATEGFTDIVALGRQNRADLYRLCAARPAPLVPDELRFPAAERTGPDGPLKPLDDNAAQALARQVAESGAEAVAVVLLHSYRHPEHERALGEALGRALGPDAHISLSHEVVGTFREYERAATTEIDAALTPLLRRYLGNLVEQARKNGLPEPAIMQSGGGLIDAAAAARHAAWMVLSGPAAGAAGGAYAAKAAGEPDVLCLDMGGTSADVCVVDGGTVRERSSGVLAGRPIALPMLDVHTVGAGGGSIAWRDAGGALRVGPRSAGAEPGPACYGRGGTEPTVTDANLLLGYLSPENDLAGGVALDRNAAERAIGHLAGEVGLDLLACAEGIVRVANAEMVRALRVITVERGVDPRRYALLAFGGAGPLHAAAIADELGIGTIVCPRASGVLAALGLIVAPRRRDAQRTVLLSGDALNETTTRETVAELGEQARHALGEPEAELSAVYELRYRGQAFELAIGAGAAPTAEELREAFEAEHEERYGYRDPEQELELVTVRVAATLAGAEPSLAAAEPSLAGAEPSLAAATSSAATPEGGPQPGRAPTRPATLHGERLELRVHTGSPPPGTHIDGPAVVELPEATLLVPPEWSGQVDDTGAIRLQR